MSSSGPNPILSTRPYVLALPKREAEAEHWQIAMEQLMDAAEGRNLSGCD